MTEKTLLDLKDEESQTTPWWVVFSLAGIFLLGTLPLIFGVFSLDSERPAPEGIYTVQGYLTWVSGESCSGDGCASSLELEVHTLQDATRPLNYFDKRAWGTGNRTLKCQATHNLDHATPFLFDSQNELKCTLS